MTEPGAAPRPGGQITRLGLFALSFGSIVGSAWVVVLGEWLRAAGPGGAALGFAAGALAILAIGACYGELAARMPRVGGDFLYVFETFGGLPAFLTGWLLTLNFVAFAAFEGIALSLLLSGLFPDFVGPVLYDSFGKPVHLASLLVGLAGIAFFAALNLAGTRRAVTFQTVLTVGFILFAASLAATGFIFGHVSNLTPAFAAQSGDWKRGALWIFSTSVLFVNGFQACAYAIEERSTALPVSAIGQAMLRSIAAAAIFYVAIILATGMIAPWRGTAVAPLPAVAAFSHIGAGSIWLGKIILVAASLSLLKTWNAIVIVGSRLLVAQARAGFLPSALAAVRNNGAPPPALMLFSVASGAGVLSGLGGLIPILNTCAVCVALSYTLVLAALIKQRREQPDAGGFPVPGGAVTIATALGGALIMGATAAIGPIVRDHGTIPLEWILLAAWSALGLLLLVLARAARRGRSSRP